jgi:hypothetical protein
MKKKCIKKNYIKKNFKKKNLERKFDSKKLLYKTFFDILSISISKVQLHFENFKCDYLRTMFLELCRKVFGAPLVRFKLSMAHFVQKINPHHMNEGIFECFCFGQVICKLVAQILEILDN